MFRKLFGKEFNNNTPREPIIPKENYSVFKLTIENELAFATINTGYNKYPNKQFYPWYTVILIEIQDRNDKGHPTDEEAEVLNDLENKITNFLKLTQTVHPIGRVTRNGERDIIYYIDKPKFNQSEVKKFFDSINLIRQMNLTVEKDEQWANVKSFLK